MPLILVVARDGEVAPRVERALGASGWRVERAVGVSEAMAAVAGEAPDLFLVDSAVEGAENLLSPFARRHGGPGTLALAAEPAAAAETAADGVVSTSFNDDELRLAVFAVLEAADRPAPAPGEPERKLTSSDIFGDLVDEFEAGDERGAELAAPPPSPRVPAPARSEATEPAEASEATDPIEPTAPLVPAPPAPSRGPSSGRRPVTDEDIERRLEQTLSGLFGDSYFGATASSASPEPPPAASLPPPPAPAAPSRRSEPVAKTRSEVDDLLDSTLSGLGLTWEGRTVKRPLQPSGPPGTPVADSLLEALPELPPAEPPPTPPPIPPPEPPPGDVAGRAPAARVPRPEGRRTPIPFEPPLADVLFEAPESLRPPSPPDVAPGTPFGQYRLLERIGVGGMAEVWKARMTGLEGFQKTVAIKKILPHLTDSPDFVEMFIDEAKLAAELNHANIIHIYDLGKIDQDYYIAMEYVEGENLRSILNAVREADRHVPLGIALYITSHLASALDHAHRRRDFEDREMGLVHRDVSPQNVLVGYEGTIKLCDFGIVKAVAKTSHTQMGALKGKLQYMSPEQAWGRAVDARSDIFSLGSILFELLTGRRLFSGASEMEILEAVREARVVPPSEVEPTVPEAVDALTLRALGRAPEDRFATAGEMARRLDETLLAMAPRPGPGELAAFLAELFDRAHGASGALPERAPALPAVDELPLDSLPELELELEGGEELGSSSSPAPAAGAPAEAPVVEDGSSPLLAVEPVGEVETEEGGARGKGWLVAAILVILILAALAWMALRPGGWLGGPAVPGAAEVTEGDRAGALGAGAAPALGDEAVVPRSGSGEGDGAEDGPSQSGDTPAPGEPADGEQPVTLLADVSGEVERLLEQRRAEMEPRIRREFEAEVLALEERRARLAREQAARGEGAGGRAALQPAPGSGSGEPIVMGPGVTPPQLVTLAKPEYPPSARQRGVEGEVVIGILVDETGRVVQARLEKGVAGAPEIDQAALAAAASARYRPAMKDGAPVKMWTMLRIPFKL